MSVAVQTGTSFTFGPPAGVVEGRFVTAAPCETISSTMPAAYPGARSARILGSPNERDPAIPDRAARRAQWTLRGGEYSLATASSTR